MPPASSHHSALARAPLRRRGARSPAAALAWLTFLVVTSLLLSACGAGTATKNDAGKDHTATAQPTVAVTVPEKDVEEDRTTNEVTTPSAPSKEAGVFFPKKPPPKGLSLPLTAAGGGRLVVENDCLLFRNPDGSSHVPVWPHDYSLRRKNGSLAVLNGKGKIVAWVGNKVRVGGGEIRKSEAGPTPEQARRNYEQKRRELGVAPQCRGPLWMVSPPERVR